MQTHDDSATLIIKGSRASGKEFLTGDFAQE